MKRILPLILALWSSQAVAQAYQDAAAARLLPGAASLHLDAQSGQLYFVRFNDAAQPEAKSLLSHSALHDYLGGHPLQATQSTQDALGMTHTRMQAYRDGHPIEGAIAVVHTRQGRVSAINADLPRKKGFSGQAALSASQAREIAAAHIGARQYVWQVPGMDNLLRAQTGDPQATYAPAPTLVYAPVDGDFEAGRYRLAWKVDVYATVPLSHDDVYVDAEDGSILWQHSLLQHVDAVGTAVTGFRGTRAITTDNTAPGVYRLSEAGRGGGIHTLNLRKRYTLSTAVEFLDTDNHWDNVNAERDEYATDVHIGMEDTYDHFLHTFQWNSVDNQAYRLVGYFHYGNSNPTAFWDGYAMGFGDGDAFFPYPFTTLHIIAHEFTHGVTQRSAGIYHYHEHGSVNESFSDILGKSVESAYHPGAWDWRVGAELNGGEGLRDMKTPNRLSHPDTYKGLYWHPFGGLVHINANVGDKWFQVLVDGETGVNDHGTPYSVTGIGMEKAAAIAFRTLTAYMTPAARYHDMCFFSIEAARDLFGDSTREVRQTINAWQAVGLGPASTVLPKAFFTVLNPYACTGELELDEVTHFGVETWHWDFGDGNTATGPYPEHVYAQNGTYSIRLIVCNAIGCDTLFRPRAIRVDPFAPCSNGVGGSQGLACEGYIHLAQGRRFLPWRKSFTVKITDARAVQVNITLIDLKPGFDTLFVHDGSSANSPLIGVYTGQTLPDNGTFTGGRDGIMLRVRSAPGEHRVRVEANYHAIINQELGPPQIQAPSTVVPGSVVEFVSLSHWVLKHEWDLGDGIIQNGILASRRFDTPGTYQVTLRGKSYSGCVLSTTKEIHVCSDCDADVGVPMLAVWPSPSNGLVEVVASLDGEAVGNLSVYDMLGKRILTFPHQSAPSQRRQIDLRGVEDGVYLVRYETDAGVIARKVVLQR